MKIAYLVLAHSNPNFLNKLCKTLNDGDNKIFIHVDKKNSSIIKNIDQSDNIKIISTQNVFWGGFSIVQATIDLIKTSLSTNEKFDFFILLSGSDYPLRNQKDIKEFLTNNRFNNFINCAKMPIGNRNMDRLYYHHTEGGFSNKTLKGMAIRFKNIIVKKLRIKRKILNLQYYSGSQWWAFNNECIKYISDYIKNNKDIVDFFKSTFIPDEMFFQTIISSSLFKDTVKPTLTYSDWEIDKPPYPAIISNLQYHILKDGKQNTLYGEQNIFFARKFNSVDSDIIKQIDRELIQVDIKTGDKINAV